MGLGLDKNCRFENVKPVRSRVCCERATEGLSLEGLVCDSHVRFDRVCESNGCVHVPRKRPGTVWFQFTCAS